MIESPTAVLPEPLTHLRPGDGSTAGIVQAAIAAFRQHPFHEVDVETVAEIGGVDVDEVRARFPEWDHLVTTTIETWNTQRIGPAATVAEEHGAVPFLRALLAANVADPAPMRFLASLVPIAATPGHPLSSFLLQEWVHFHAVVQRTLMADVHAGRETAGLDCARASEQLIAVYEGLQIQALMRPGMRLLEGFDQAVARLRDGWAQISAVPVWHI